MPNEYREMIEHAIEDELNTSRFYYNMARAAGKAVCASLLDSASNDEYRHAQILSAILAGQHRRPCDSAESGAVDPGDLEKAVQGELSAICEYATLAKLAPNMEERMLFVSILGDEYGHMRLFTAMEASGCR